jgi:transcriptional regulator with XRE-family HTH domain
MPLSLADKVRAILSETGLSQAGLADAMGVSHQRIRNMTTGRVQKLHEEETRALVQELHINGQWLATGEGRIRQSSEEIALEERLRQLRETTRRSSELSLAPERQVFVRDILYGVAMNNAALIDATIDGFLATHGPPPAPPSESPSKPPKVAQAFHGNVGQVAGGNIINKGKRKK